MTEAGRGLPDAACVAYYRTIRAHTTPAAAQIGHGVNRRPPHPGVRQWFEALYADVLAGRVTDYEDSSDERERALVADLAADYLGLGGLGPEHVVLCNGTTEAISIVLGYAARAGMAAVLPLPVYCSFEQSAVRHGVPVAGYHSLSGRTWSAPEWPGPRLLVDIAPNGVIGGWAAPAFGGRAHEADLRVVDHVFALPTFTPAARFHAELRGRVGDLERTAVLLSPSKDLSVPGLRCGTVVTRHPGLLAYARADRFERGYSVQAGLPRLAAAHLALLISAFDPASTVGHDRFRAAGLPAPGPGLLAGFAAHMTRMRVEFGRVADLIDHSGLFRPMDGPGSAAGYSGMRRLDRVFPSAEVFTDWVREAGRAGLKLNPNYLFGGDEDLWEQLYPGQHGIRVNYSTPLDEVGAALDLLRRLL
ncbi:hypothetical protein ACLQ26_27745 [Micromonospora sp. DT43]|uniref:hypothetical protein n=1 Tax=Micromonospora sp. DT43 TaxID=3393440 RepID=UPI003CEAF8F5